MPILTGSGSELNGTSTLELIVGVATGGDGQTINGGGGEDAILAGHGPVITDTSAANGSFATALNIDAVANWTTGSNPFVADAAIPYATILGVGQGQNDWFSVTLGAGQTLTLDVDFANSQYGTTPWDTQIQVTDSSGVQVALNDDSTPDQGGLGSFRYNLGINATRDTYLTWTATTAGTYYINLGAFGGTSPAAIPAARTYMLSVSVTGHASSGNVAQNGFNAVDGGDGSDYLVGAGGTDWIRGGSGALDYLHGMGGNDTLEGGAGSDQIDGGDGIDRVSYEHASAGVDASLSAPGTDVGGGEGADNFISIEGLTGSAFADTLSGDGATNYLSGLGGSDTLYGRGGNDLFEVLDGTGHDTIEGGADYDTVDLSNGATGWTLDYTSGSFTNGTDTIAMNGIEAIVGTNAADVLYAPVTLLDFNGNGGDDVYYSSAVENASFSGGDGVDRLDFTHLGFTGYYAADFEVGFDSFGLIISGVENISTGGTNDELYGDSQDNVFRSGGAADSLYGRGGNDTLEGGAGDDSLDGGEGFDWASYESAVSGVSVTLTTTLAQSTGGAGFDALNFIEALIGSSFNDNLTGNGLDNWFEAKGGNDTVAGGSGNDTFFWEEGGGEDIFNGGDGAGDILYLLRAGSGWTVDLGAGIASNGLGGSVDLTSVEQVYGSDFADDLTANGSGGSTLYGFGGDDVIRIANNLPNAAYGGNGIDTLDTTAVIGVGLNYVIDLAAGTTNFGETIAEFEYLVSGETDDFVTGTDGANILETQSGNDTIEGGLGDDRIDGGSGSDTASYAGASAGVTVQLDRAVQKAGAAGRDTLLNIENATGSAFADLLIGSGKENVLDGGAGADTMRGGNGEDVYWVDNAGDMVVEIANQGSDLVNSFVTYSLAGQYVEVLNLLGTATGGTGNGLANRLVGNGLANILYGMDGSDRLDGGAGADTMRGGLGNDVFVVDNAADMVEENNGEGTDTVEASIGYSLVGRFVELLTLTGSANINGTGNGLANTITGNSGNNVLDGRGGADSLRGGAGDDRYIVDHAGDTVTELIGQGNDTVESSVSFSLAGQYVETLILTGSAAINGSGNSQANAITGNSAANTLRGEGGADALHGGLGNDTLFGGAGADGFWFETALGSSNIDIVSDFVVVDDTIWLDRTIFTGIAADGALAAGAFRIGTAALDADDRILYDSATGNLWYDRDGAGGVAAVQFAKLAAGLALTSADFVAQP